MNKKSGLVYSYILKDGGGRPVDWSEIKQWDASQGILWLHLDYTENAVRQWLLDESGIDEVSCESLLVKETRPRIVTHPNAMLLILRGVNFNPGADPEDMVSIRMWFEENRIITMRHRRVKAVEDINRRIEAGEGPETVSEFLVSIVSRIADRMGNVISEIDDSVDELEDLVLSAESYELRQKLSDLRRKTISLRRYISPQRDVLARLQTEQVSWFQETDRVRIREITERTARFIDDIDSARDRSAITQEELNNRLSEQMNKTMYILSIVAAIFLPLGFLTGLLGVNVGGIPGTENQFGFAFVTIFIVVMAIVQMVFFKVKKWL